MPHILRDHLLKIEVKDGRLGKGVYAKQDIQPGEVIFRFVGPRMTVKEFLDKYEWSNCNPLQISESIYLDLITPYVYINHSCNPNAGVRNEGILFALKSIKKGTEITFDYSTTVDDPAWNMNCECLEKNCRGIIADFQTIPFQQMQYYLDNNAITSYIKGVYF